MGRQMMMFSDTDAEPVDDSISSTEARVLVWNIQNPSAQRAREQLDWLVDTKANAIVLCEAKASSGSHYLISSLEAQGYSVSYTTPVNDGYCTAVATKGFPHQRHLVDLAYQPARVAAADLTTFIGKLRLVGVYALSHGLDRSDSARRHQFQRIVTEWLDSAALRQGVDGIIIGGDLNVIDPEHPPTDTTFTPEDYEFYNAFERVGLTDAYKHLNAVGHDYSWVSRQGIGQRLDHLFISANIVPHLAECRYLHDPRHRKLSDHSALWLKLTVQQSSGGG
ncbi:MAG TPA: endonuclease/exonuclease/phosphatase family protein [Nitrospira sp.]|nr:endonuclease/exonuclease/phosphatase family protein [Nitrospira sp.]